MNMTWLAHGYFDTAWAHLPTTDFSAWAVRPGALAVLPVYGYGDHGMGLSLDAEEAVGSALLTAACAEAAAQVSPLVLPPLRFGPFNRPETCWFGVSLELGFDLVAELAAGVRAAGFDRMLIFSTSPWHREWLDAAARDVRVETGMAVYRVHLASLGIDFHPAAPASIRVGTQALAAGVLGQDPVVSPRQVSQDETFRPGNWVHASPLPGGPVGAERAEAARRVRVQAGERLGRLLVEAASHRANVSVARPASVVVVSPSVESPSPWRPFGLRALTAHSPGALAVAARRPGAVAVLPVGAIEQHGPHLPVGVDAILGQGLLARALAKLPAQAPVYVAPPVVVGKSNEHADWPGTLSLTSRTLVGLVRALVEELHRLGFRRVALFNTHGGNSAVLVGLVRELQRLEGLRIGLLQSGYKPEQTPQEAAYGFHGGEWETSLMLALAPSLVRRARACRHYPVQLDDPGELRPEGSALTFGWTARDIAPQGVVGDATMATPAQGEQWLEASAAALAARLAGLCAG